MPHLKQEPSDYLRRLTPLEHTLKIAKLRTTIQATFLLSLPSLPSLNKSGSTRTTLKLMPYKDLQLNLNECKPSINSLTTDRPAFSTLPFGLWFRAKMQCSRNRFALAGNRMTCGKVKVGRRSADLISRDA